MSLIRFLYCSKDYQKCSIVKATLKEHALIHGLIYQRSKPQLNLDLAEDESKLSLIGTKARLQFICTVVVTEFGNPEDLSQNHQKLLSVIKPLKTELLILLVTGKVLWQDMKIFPSKTVILQSGWKICLL